MKKSDKQQWLESLRASLRWRLKPGNFPNHQDIKYLQVLAKILEADINGTAKMVPKTMNKEQWNAVCKAVNDRRIGREEEYKAAIAAGDDLLGEILEGE